MIHAFIVLKNVCSKVLWKNGSVSAKRSGLNPVSFSACSSAFAALYSRLCSNRSGKPPDCAIWSWRSSSVTAAESNSLMASGFYSFSRCVKDSSVFSQSKTCRNADIWYRMGSCLYNRYLCDVYGSCLQKYIRLPETFFHKELPASDIHLCDSSAK